MRSRNLRILTALSLAVAAHAQSSDTTGAFRGKVLTAKNAPLPGAIVSIRNLGTGLTRSSQAGADGGYSIGLLPVGTYRVSVKAPGMKTVEETVQVSLGEAASLTFRMVEEVAAATVEIIATSQTLDAAQVNQVASVDEKLVQSIPLVSRNFIDLVRLTPGAVAGPGNPPRLMVEGARQIMNNLQIDGATNNSNFFGEQRGGAIIPFVFGADTIRELQVITNGYDAQYGNAAGAVINAITKSGTNDFGGSALYLVRNDKWMAMAKPTPYEASAGQNSAKNLTRVGDSYNMNFTAGGPIIKDKLFYFVGYETFGINRMANPAFGSSTQPGNTAIDFSNFLAATRLMNVLTSRNGHTFGAEGTTQYPYMQETKNTSYFGRVDYNFNESHRFTLRVNYNKFKDTIGGGNSVFTPESNELLNTTNAISWVLEHSAVWTPEIVSESRLQVSNERRPFDGNGVSPAISVPGFTAGTKTSTPRQMNEIMTELINNTTWTRGDWTFKGGLDLQTIAIGNQFFNNGNGAISFSSYNAATAWANGTLGAGTVGNNTGTNRLVRYNGATSINGGRVDIDTKLNSEYLQAQYVGLLDKRLTLTGGLRFTQLSIGGNPRPNANLAGLDSARGSSSVDPRIAFSLDLDGKGKTVLRGGHGWFSTPIPMLLVANTMTGNGNTIVNYQYDFNPANAANTAVFNSGFLSAAQLINGSTFSKASDANLAALAVAPYTGTGAGFAFPLGSASSVQVWDPENKMSRAKKTSLGIEHDLGNGLFVSSKITYTEFSNLQYLQNINLNQGAVLTPIAYNDGYASTLNRFSTTNRPGTATVRGRVLNFAPQASAPGNPAGGFGDVFLVKGDAIGRYKAINFEVKKIWSPEAGFQANITFSKAMDNNSNERGTFSSPGELPDSVTSNPANPRADWGYSNADRFMVLNAMAYFPVYFGVKGSVRFNYATGLPYTAIYASDVNTDGISNDIAFGGRNGQRQPDTKTMDLRLTRAWKVYKQYEVEVSADIFNVFNWANQSVNSNEMKVNLSPSGAFNPAYGAVGGRDFNTREAQLGIRVRF